MNTHTSKHLEVETILAMNCKSVTLFHEELILGTTLPDIKLK